MNLNENILESLAFKEILHEVVQRTVFKQIHQ